MYFWFHLLCFVRCLFMYEAYNVPSSFFFDLVPKILNCICLADLLALSSFSQVRYFLLYLVVYALFLSFDQTYRGKPANHPPPSCASLQMHLLFVNVPCIMYDVLYLNVSLLNVTLLSSFYVHCKVTPLSY